MALLFGLGFLFLTLSESPQLLLFQTFARITKRLELRKYRQIPCQIHLGIGISAFQEYRLLMSTISILTMTLEFIRSLLANSSL